MQPDPHDAALMRLTAQRCFSVEAARDLGLPGHILRRALYRRSSRSLRFLDAAPAELLRLLIIAAGLPEPEVNQWITDDAGHRVSRPDLQYRVQRIALEYEGEHHLTDPRQWARDIDRDDRLRALGWTVLRFTKRHLGAGREDALARVCQALTRCSVPARP